MPGLLSFTLTLQNSQFKSAAAASTQQENQFTESVKEATKRLKEQQGLINSAPKPPPLPPPPDPAPVERHTQSIRHLRHEIGLASEIAGQFGADLGRIGSLAGLAFSPLLVALGTVSIAVSLLKERWQKLHEQMVETLESMANVRNALREGIASAANTAADTNANFTQSLAHSADSLDRESEAMHRNIQLFRARVDAQNEVFQAQTRATEAQIEADEAMHRISGPEALRRRQAAEAAAMQSGFTAHNAGAQKEIEEKKQRLDQANERLAAASQAHSEAVHAAEPGNALIDAQKVVVAENERVRNQARDKAADEQATLNQYDQLPYMLRPAKDRGLYQRQKGLVDSANAMKETSEQDLIGARNSLSLLEREQSFRNAAIQSAKTKAEIEQRNVNTLGAEIQQHKDLLATDKEKQKGELAAQQKLFHAQQEQKQAAQFEKARELFGATDFEKRHSFSSGLTGPAL